MKTGKTNLTLDEVKHIAKLANLFLTDKEAKKLSQDLSETLSFIDQIKKISTKGLKPTSHVTGLENVFREDEIKPSLSQEETLSGVDSDSQSKGYFKVKAVLED